VALGEDARKARTGSAPRALATAGPRTSISTYFASLTDPRVDRTKEHRLVDIVTIALCAVLCGADSWVAVETFGRAKEGWLRTLLGLPNGIPSHDTFGRVFARSDPEEFRRCFLAWVQAVAGETAGQVVAIDEASNELTAIPAVLRLLALEGCTVTIDAMGCQAVIAARIVEQRADYVLALKDNRPTLRDVAFREEDSRVRTDHPPQNFAILRHFALNLLGREPSHGSITTKRFRAALDDRYLLALLAHLAS
jgi:predicted transposase YbfD/YdcC